MRNSKGLGAVQALLSNNENIPVLSAQFPVQIQNSMILDTAKKINSIPDKIAQPPELVSQLAYPRFSQKLNLIYGK